MNQELSPFNFSLNKLLATESNTLEKARIKILYYIILFSVLKSVIVLISTYYEHQQVQFARTAASLCFSLIVLKIHLGSRKSIRYTPHVLGINALVMIFLNLFLTAQTVNILTMQFVAMIMLSGFYLLNRYWGIVYSVLTSLLIVTFCVFQHYGHLPFHVTPQPLKYPADFILIVLNFSTIIICHYLYHQAFNNNMNETEKLNEQLNVSIEKANKLAQSRSDFLSTMSHELRTPLNMVIGISEILIDSSREPEQKENLRVLNFSAKNLHTIINDILDFNKLESGKLQLDRSAVNLYELIHSVCSGLDLQAKEKGLFFEVNIAGELKPLNVITDSTRIAQIIYNLAGNGIKFTSSGKVSVSLQIISQSSERVYIRFMVSDTGIGISKEQQQTVFDPFVQASTSTTRKFGGTGLGLSIVKQLLSLFNSNIHVVSAPGKGSQFSFEIDFEKDKTTDISSLIAQNEEQTLEGMKLLAAEDNHLNTFLLNKLCTKWNINPVIVKNGAEAVEAMKINNYDIILMDIHMPEMDGYQASKLIREMNEKIKSEIPIIALTASVSHDLEEKIKAAGMNDFVRKPFHSEELFVKLKKHHK